jgi:hypothetical protein
MPMTTAELPTQELVAQLRADRQWLLRQIDAGRWPEWRLDLAALERELGQCSLADLHYDLRSAQAVLSPRGGMLLG